MKTINRNREKALDAIFSSAKNFRTYSLENGFTGTELKPDRMTPAEYLRHELATFSFCKLQSRGNGGYVLKVHSNLWFEFEAGVTL